MHVQTMCPFAATKCDKSIAVIKDLAILFTVKELVISIPHLFIAHFVKWLYKVLE